LTDVALAFSITSATANDLIGKTLLSSFYTSFDALVAAKDRNVTADNIRQVHPCYTARGCQDPLGMNKSAAAILLRRRAQGPFKRNHKGKL
jgi:hypothetical protein